MSKYAKSLLAVVVTVVMAVVSSLSDDTISAAEWIQVAIAGTTACAVFAAPNVPGARYTKAILAVLGAILVGLAADISNGITQAELLNLLVAAAGAIGVYAVPNSGSDLDPADAAVPNTGVGPDGEPVENA